MHRWPNDPMSVILRLANDPWGVVPIRATSGYTPVMPRKKAPGTTADPRNGERFALVMANGEPKCALPETIRDNPHPLVQDAYDRYWTDPVSAILQESDLVLVQSYFALLNRYFVMSEAADEEPMVLNSSGTVSANPKYTIANHALVAADRMMRQLGIGPANRAKLGIDLVAADEATKRGFERGDTSPSGNITLRPREDPRDEEDE